MKIESRLGIVDCRDIDDIEKIIMECSIGLNEICVFGESEYPYMTISVNQEKAVLHYFKSEQCSQSFGNNYANNDTEFFAGGEVWNAPGEVVIPLSSAIESVKQFFKTQERPTCIKWNEL